MDLFELSNSAWISTWISPSSTDREAPKTGEVGLEHGPLAQKASHGPCRITLEGYLLLPCPSSAISLASPVRGDQLQTFHCHGYHLPRCPKLPASCAELGRQEFPLQGSWRSETTNRLRRKPAKKSLPESSGARRRGKIILRLWMGLELKKHVGWFKGAEMAGWHMLP